MDPQFTELLCCPQTGKSLQLQIDERNEHGMVITGKLLTDDGQAYPIVRGIPRFIGSEHYSASFGYEWNRWPRVQFESDNAGKPMAGHTLHMWETITHADETQIRDKRIVEFGCGSGRFLDIVRRKGGIAIGIDLSLAVEAARKNFAHDPNVLIIQGDILNPPFGEQVFDGGYTIGVLHHTPTPADGLAALAATIRPGGWLACCVYTKNSFYDSRAVERFRAFFNRMGPTLRHRLALAYAYFSAYLLSPIIRGGRIPIWGRLIRYLRANWIVTMLIPDVRWRILDTFDAITPAYVSTHTEEEVRSWMTSAGCVQIETTAWCPTAQTGLKT